MAWENHLSEYFCLGQKRQEEQNHSANSSITYNPVTSSSQVSINYLATCASSAWDEWLFGPAWFTFHLISFLLYDTLAKVECQETLSALSHVLLPALLRILWTKLVFGTLSCTQQCVCLPSQRKTIHNWSCFRPTQIRYNLFKRNKKRIKSRNKRSFRKIGFWFSMWGDKNLNFIGTNPDWHVHVSCGCWFSNFSVVLKVLCGVSFHYFNGLSG